MKIKELIELLRKEDPERMIIMSCDGEGNNYSPMVQEFSVGFYVADNTWCGEFHTGEPDPEDEDEEFDEDEATEGEPCIVFWPTN